MDFPLVFSDIGDGVAVLSIHNPPVNALNAAVRAQLWHCLDTLEHDAAVQAVVIAGRGLMFSGGGDLRELGRPDAPRTITLGTLARRIEAFAKPVLAALHGRCIGGGVLLAMACHARLGERDTCLMLPELGLGLVPGAGGTQRLPRLIGVRAALDIVVRNRELDADAAFKAGLLDAVHERDVAAQAVIHARRMLEGNAAWRRTDALAPAPLDEQTRAALRREYAGVAQQCFPGRQAALEAVDLILDADLDGFEQGLLREREVFARLSTSPQARALLHLFFAGRVLAKRHDAPAAEARSLVAGRLSAAYRAKLDELAARGLSIADIQCAAAYYQLPAADGAAPGASPAPGSKAAGQELLQAFVDEARACLDEGLVAHADDIDVIAVKACGFPALLGGPLHHAAKN